MRKIEYMERHNNIEIELEVGNKRDRSEDTSIELINKKSKDQISTEEEVNVKNVESLVNAQETKQSHEADTLIDMDTEVNSL